MAFVEILRKDGWYLNTSALEEHFTGKNTVDDIKKTALDYDLKLIGQSSVAEVTWRNKSDTVDGPLVLQIQKVRNVCIPKTLEDSSVSSGVAQLLRLTLTDGQQTMSALEMDGRTGVGLNTPPGTKLKLVGKVDICNGYLLLYKTNCKLLGGHVQSLVESWNLKRSLATHNRDAARSDVAGGPPPFIPFAQRCRGDKTSRHVHFKALEAGDKKKEMDSDFEQQRKAVIEAAMQQQTQTSRTTAASNPAVKQQLSDKNIATIVEMGFTIQQATTALQHTGGNLDAALTSLLPPDDENVSTSGQPAPSSMEPRTAASTSNGPSHRTDKTETRSRHTPTDSSYNDRSGGRRGHRRTGSQQDDSDYNSSRPSAPATLFDFVTSKMSSSLAADVEASTSSSVSDSVKSSSPPQSSAGKSNSSSQPQSNLPPRLQRKQRQAEEENYMKYYKPMDYMRQNNSYHRKTTAAASGRQRGAESGRHQNGTASAHHVADINSRGSVGNRKLWTDNLTSVSNDRCGSGMDDDGSDVRFDCRRSSATGDTRHADGEQKRAPVVVLTSSSNKLTASLEADVASLNIQSTAPSNMTSQLSHAQPNSMASVNGSRRWQIGDVCMAKYWQDNEYYKARIESIASGGGGSKKHVTVFFTDYGNRERVSFADIRELPDETWISDHHGGSGGTYGQQAVYSIIPATVTHGSNMVYQQQSGAASESMVRGDASAFYYQPTYMQMTSGGVHQMSAAAAAGSNCPAPGILVQGPPPMQIFTSPPQEVFQSGDGSTSSKTESARTVRSQPHMQVYIPPAQRH